MQRLAEFRALSAYLGRVIVISAPANHAPDRLDWTRWIANTVNRFEKFERPPPAKVTLLDVRGTKVEPIFGVALEFSRLDLQTLDPISLFSESLLGVLHITHGTWLFTLSSWVESLKQIASAKFRGTISTFLNEQFQIWCQLMLQSSISEFFVLPDSGTKFANAADMCKNWADRAVRSRTLPEHKLGGWCAAIMQVFGKQDRQCEAQMIREILTLTPRDWCGDPEWHRGAISRINLTVENIEEVWISIPNAGLTLDLFDRLKSLGLSKNAKLFAPSTVVGWHPIRDFMLCANRIERRIFIYMDSSECLQFLLFDQTIVQESHL
ncbi:MAG: hypothetical protein NTV34_18900 [Proteobacteria bacterium]|nr:hypothetical protein [Pseudomonadota bacterium]